MPPKQSNRGLKTAATPKSTSKPKKISESEASVPMVIDISKLGSDRVDIRQRQASDWKLQSSILPGDTSPVVELNKVDLTEGEKDVPPSDASELGITTSALDEEARTAAETFKALQRQPPTADLPGSSSLLTPPGDEEHFEGGWTYG